MIVTVILFLAGLLCLIKGGDMFVDSSVNIARRFSLPELIIGATVVSVGTTLPEVMVSATSALGGQGEIAYGNAIGSIICNTSLICAITLCARPGKAERKSLAVPVLFFFASSMIYIYISYKKGYFSRQSGLVLFSVFILYILVSVLRSRRLSSSSKAKISSFEPLSKNILVLIFGAGVIAVGARLVVDNGIIIARMLGVPQSVIALTLVALGTSLPELVTAITSLVKGHGALSLGNVIGANLFNLVLVSSVSAILSPFDLPEDAIVYGKNASLVIDIPVMLAVMMILTLPALIKERTYRIQGVVLLAIYGLFCLVRFAL